MTTEDALRERIAVLETENAWFKEQLGITFDRAPVLGAALNLTPAQARILLLLHAAKGRVLTGYFIDEHLPQYKNHERLSDNAVKIQLMHLRRRLGKGIVANLWGHGYFLTPAGLRLVDTALGG